MKSFTFPYDLGVNMEPGRGSLSFDERGMITSTFQGTVALELSADKVEETVVVPGVGCALLMAKMQEGEDLLLCRFSMSSLKPAGEFIKMVNYYKQSGNVAIPDEVEAQVCPKCGRPFMEGMHVCLFCYDKMAVLKQAGKLMKPYLKQIITSQSFLAISSILYLLVPVFNRILIDNHLQPKIGPVGTMILLCAAMFGARAIGEVIFIFSARMFNKPIMNYTNQLRNMAYEKLQYLSMNSLSKRTPGDMIRRVTEDTAVVKDFLSDNGRFMVEQVISFAIVIVLLLITNWKLTLLVFLPMPIVMVALSRFWRFIHIRYERQWRKSSRANSILHDIIRGIRTVKSFGNEELEIKKFAKASRELAEVSSSNERLWSLLFPTLIFFTGIGEFLVLYFGGTGVISGAVTLGTLVQFNMFIGYVYGPLRWVVRFPQWLAEAMTSMVKIFEILDEKPEIAETAEPKNTDLAGGVTFDGVFFGYKSYEPVLKDVSIDVKPGEMIGLVGKSGVGKSTLINLVMRLYDPNIGSVRIGGTDIRDMSPRYLHENIGVVFQDTFLFAGTIYENIVYAKPDATPDDVIAACKAANAHDFIMKTSDGYNTIVGENGHSLSGGERQRIAIARAIIKDPSILILDEATSSLDVETESAIQESLTRLTQGRTTIAIAHRLSTLRSADRLVVLDKGKVAEVGTHVELLKKKGIYYNLVMAQRKTSKIAEEGGEKEE